MQDQKDKKDKTPKEEPLKGLEPEKSFLDELRKNADADNIKIMAISFNPFIFIVTVLIVAGLLFAYFKANHATIRSVNLGDFITNIKENNYSEIQIQNTGSEGTAIAKGNELEFTQLPENEQASFIDSKDTKVISSDKIEKQTLDNVVKNTTDIDVRDALTLVLNSKNSQLYRQIWSINNKLYTIEENGKVGVVDNVPLNILTDQYSRKNFDINNLPATSVLDAQTTGKAIGYDEFVQKFSTGEYQYVVMDGNFIIGRINPKNVITEKLDWGALSTDFPKLLKSENINMDDPNVKIIPETKEGFNFQIIIQLAVLGAVVFLVVNILRGMNGGGKGLMQFGQSKAKIFFGRKPEVTFKDVAGVDSAKEELNEVVMFLKDPKRFTRLGARIPKGLLMVGSPGTGKTLLARAIAGEAGVPFFHTSGSEFEEMLVGAGASRVRDLFEKAKKASPSLVFIDEIDAVARKRGTTVQSSTTEQTLNQILVEMDGFEKNTNVIVIAATNRPDVLDPAILRPGRFDRRIVIELPDIKGREDILAIHAKNKPLAADVSIQKVARRTVGYSGADLENLLNEAAIIVAKDNRSEITFNDIEEAANRVTMGRERKIERDTEEIKKTAYHEAGHAIIAKLTPESDPVHRITIISRGMALGVTMQLPEKDKYSQSFVEMESRLRVLMGGRAAEELMYGADNITSGASNDIEKATGIARRMVKNFGYSSKLGMVKYGDSNELQYLGYGYGEQRDYAESTATLIDDEVKRIINEAYEDAKKILRENKNLLEKISDDLVKYEVLEGEQFDKYFEKKSE